MSASPSTWIPFAAACAVSVVLATPAGAQESRGDAYLRKGKALFRQGFYLKASENFRLALLEDPSSAEKKLAFGHALFAVGNYSYASYALRKGVSQLPPNATFRPDIEGLFPSSRAFEVAVRDLKRYVTYSPRDPAGLTVLGYVLYSKDGEERRCRDMLGYLERIDKQDPFARYFTTRLDAEERTGRRTPRQPVLDLPEPESEPELPPARIEIEPTEPSPELVKQWPEVKEVVENKRLGERTEIRWPKPTPALSE